MSQPLIVRLGSSRRRVEHEPDLAGCVEARVGEVRHQCDYDPRIAIHAECVVPPTDPPP